ERERRGVGREAGLAINRKLFAPHHVWYSRSDQDIRPIVASRILNGRSHGEYQIAQVLSRQALNQRQEQPRAQKKNARPTPLACAQSGRLANFTCCRCFLHLEFWRWSIINGIINTAGGQRSGHGNALAAAHTKRTVADAT